MKMLEFLSVSKFFGKTAAVSDLSLKIFKNECAGIFGPNGAGKSTFVNMICGIIVPDTGTIFFKGTDICKRGFRWNSSLGMVRENNDLFEYLTVRENILFCAKLNNIQAAEAEKRTEELLELFGLSEFSDTPAKEASQGTRKKTAISSSLVYSPEVLLLDESFNGLDTVSADAFGHIISRRKNMTVIITSHSLNEAEKIISRAVFLTNGRKQEDSDMQSIAENCGNLETRYLQINKSDRKSGDLCKWI